MNLYMLCSKDCLNKNFVFNIIVVCVIRKEVEVFSMFLLQISVNKI